MPDITPTPAPATQAPRASLRRDPRWQLRLIISVPALLILFILAYGMVSYLAFMLHWDELDRTAAGPVVSDLLRTHMTAMVVLAALAALAGVILSTTILRPIQSIVEAARSVALGRLDSRAAELPAAAELDDLSRSFNAMIDNLNRSIAERNRRLMEGLPIGVMTTGLDGRVSAVNPAAAQMLGVAPEQILGRRVAELQEAIAKPSHVLVEYLMTLIEGDEPPAEAEVVLSDDGQGQGLAVTSTILRDSHGEPFSVMLSFRETARLRDLSDHLGRSDQLAALGTFTLGLAHELHNPLGAIKGLSQLLQLESGLPARAADFLARMVREVDRVEAFVRQLIDLSEQPLACLAPTSLGACLQRAAELARQGAGAQKSESIRLVYELEPMPQLMLEGDRLVQAFAKLAQNAYEFTPEGGTITLRTRQERRAGRAAWLVEVRNTGAAIPPEQRKKIFEPFFTTRERATGLGLTIANQIVIQNGGALSVDCEDGEVIFTAAFDAARPATSEGAGATPGGLS